MKKLLTNPICLALMTIAHGAFAQYIDVCGYWPADTGQFEAPVGNYVTPDVVYLNFDATQDFKAKAVKGWMVDGWYTSSSRITEDNSGTLLVNTSGKSTLTRSYEGGANEYLAVKYRYIKYKIRYLLADGSTTNTICTTGDNEYSNSVKIAYVNGVEIVPSVPTGLELSGDWVDVKGVGFATGQSRTGESFSELDSVHEDGHIVKLTKMLVQKTYSISSSGENCTVSVKASANYRDAVTVSWTPASQVGTVYAFKSAEVLANGQVIKTLSSNGTTATFKMSDLNAYYGAVSVKVTYTSAPTTHSLSVRSSDTTKGTVTKSPDQSKYDYGTSVTIEAYANDGYAFWKWNEDDSRDSNRVISVKSNATYTASFTNRVYALTFDLNGGISCPESSRRLEYLATIGTLPVAKQFGMTHTGWYTEPSGGRQVSSLDRYEWTQDVRLYAQWVKAEEITIQVDILNGDTPCPDVGDVTILPELFEKGDQVTLTATPRTGYSFRDWNDGNASPVTNFTVSGNLRLAAVFTGNVYRVKFDLDGKGEDPDPILVTYGSAIGALPTPVLKDPGYQFDCWVDDDGNPVTESTVVTFTKATNWLYARVSPRPTYRIAFSGGEGSSGSMSEQTAYCGIPVNLTSNSFDRSGYRFLGWATNELEAANQKITYEDGAQVVDLAPADGTNTLYAAWRAWTLAEAMHCTNLVWTNAVKTSKVIRDWTVRTGAGTGSNTCSCVRQHVESLLSSWPAALTPENALSEDGTLSFYWKPSTSDIKLIVWLDADKEYTSIPDAEVAPEFAGSSEEWTAFSTNVTKGSYIHIITICTSGSGEIDIDLMSWTPGGPKPEPGDAVEISSAGVSDGKFKLSFLSDEKFGYNLLTNANLLIDGWGVMTNAVGTGGAITFEPMILPDQPQLFYKVETTQRK